MAVGTSTYKGLAVPLHGESEVRQLTAATDIFTLTRITSGTGDYFVCRDDGGTEVFVVGADGGITIAAGAYINMGTTVTTAPTTGLVKGDMMVGWKDADTPALGMCISLATQAVMWISPFDSATLGRASV